MIGMSNYVPRVVQEWCDTIQLTNPYKQLSFYSKEPVLMATFENMLVGREELYEYFIEFLDKKNLNCKITENITQIDADRDTQIASGLYTFTFYDMMGEYNEVNARYTFVICQGKIIAHHSSVEPD